MCVGGAIFSDYVLLVVPYTGSGGMPPMQMVFLCSETASGTI